MNEKKREDIKNKLEKKEMQKRPSLPYAGHIAGSPIRTIPTASLSA